MNRSQVMKSTVRSYLHPATLPLSSKGSDRDNRSARYAISNLIIIKALVGIVVCLCLVSIPRLWHHAVYESFSFQAIPLPAPIPLSSSVTAANPEPTPPPTYASYHLNELSLPQHNPDLPFPEGRTGRYIWFSEHVRGAGWGNALQEHFLHGLLAYVSKRSFVFDNFTGNNDGSLYSDFNGKLIPSRIPLTVLISGPLAGGSFPPGDTSPRAVRKEYFDEICPNPKLLDKAAVRATLPDGYSAATVMNAWIKLLDETPEECVEINERIFDIHVFGSRRVLDIIPILFQSPMITMFRWSPLIVDALEKNSAFFSLGAESIPSGEDLAIIPGLLTLHLRRGDFEYHCSRLVEWGSSWTGFNQIPGLDDHFVVPTRDENGNLSQESLDKFRRSCYPSIAQIIQKVRRIRYGTDAGRRLQSIFIMTNARPEWISELKEGLKGIGNWSRVASSRDLVLNWEQRHVKHAVDMLIGQRADVFVGNGFSSLTANIVMLRMASGLDHDRTRLW